MRGLRLIGVVAVLSWAAPALAGQPVVLRGQVAASGPITLGDLFDSSGEASNVDPVSEITALIVAQRAYEMNSKVITTADQMLQTNTQMKS